MSWTQRDPIPQSVKEEIIGKARAERAALIRDVSRSPLRALRQLLRRAASRPIDGPAPNGGRTGVTRRRG